MSNEQHTIKHTLIKTYIKVAPDECATRFERLPTQEASDLMVSLADTNLCPMWEAFSPDFAKQVFMLLPTSISKNLLENLSIHRAKLILSMLDDMQQADHLNRLSPSRKTLLAKALSYPQETAGALMDPNFIALKPDMTVADALLHLRKLPRETVRRVIFLVDDEFKLIQLVDVQKLALAEASALLSTLCKDVRAFTEDTSTREQVVALLEKYRVTDLPVVDYAGRLVGVLRYKTLMVSSKAESMSDLLTMVGASKEERALSTAWFSICKRQPWLQINLLTAFLAASVVGMFESTIATFTALAVLLPVVAGQSGNTGAQALAVTMRGLALREVQVMQWMSIIFKEARVAFVNGIAVSATTCLGVYLWSRSLGLTLIIGISMITSMFIAGLAGAGIPIILSALKQDPAQSSSIILTTVTDVAGFFSFLGIATLLSFLLI